MYVSKETELGEANKWHKIILEREYSPLTRFIEDFADAVLSGRQPPITGEDGRKALEVIVAAYESGLKNVPIELPMSQHI